MLHTMNNVDLGIWGTLTRIILVLLVASAILAVVAMYWPLLKQNERMRQVVYSLDAQIEQEKAREHYTRTAIDAMSNNPKTVERLAREKLGYAKPGETIIRFEERSANPIGETVIR